MGPNPWGAKAHSPFFHSMLSIFSWFWDTLTWVFHALADGVTSFFGWIAGFLSIVSFWSTWNSWFDSVVANFGTYITEFFSDITTQTLTQIFAFVRYIVALDYLLYLVRILVKVVIFITGLAVQILCVSLGVFGAVIVFLFVLRVIRMVSAGVFKP